MLEDFYIKTKAAKAALAVLFAKLAFFVLSEPPLSGAVLADVAFPEARNHLAGKPPDQAGGAVFTIRFFRFVELFVNIVSPRHRFFLLFYKILLGFRGNITQKRIALHCVM